MAWTQLLQPGQGPGPTLLTIFIALLLPHIGYAAPFPLEQTSDLEYYPVADATGCYYNFQHYDEGDRIITNEPCLNCTCHNKMLMCYLKVCPFIKAIGQDCKVEKKPDQCCPSITCPEVHVHVDTTTPSTNALGHPDEYGCSIDSLFYADGARVPSHPNNPCELCYCIRNKTACVMQECTLNIEGCKPVYQEGVCCPVRYDCDHPTWDQLETTTTERITTQRTTTPGLIFTTTTLSASCVYNDDVYADGALVKKDIPCEQCYCMKGDIVCAVQECAPTPLDKVNCTAVPPTEGHCCPQTYDCQDMIEDITTELYEYTTFTPEPETIEPEIVPTTVGLVDRFKEGDTVTPSEEEGEKEKETEAPRIEEEHTTTSKPISSTEGEVEPEQETKAVPAEEGAKEHTTLPSVETTPKEVTGKVEYPEATTHIPSIEPEVTTKVEEGSTPKVPEETSHVPEEHVTTKHPVEPTKSEGEYTHIPEDVTKTSPESYDHKTEATQEPQTEKPEKHVTEVSGTTGKPEEEITTTSEPHIPHAETTPPEERVQTVSPAERAEKTTYEPHVTESTKVTTETPIVATQKEAETSAPEIVTTQAAKEEPAITEKYHEPEVQPTTEIAAIETEKPIEETEIDERKETTPVPELEQPEKTLKAEDEGKVPEAMTEIPEEKEKPTIAPESHITEKATTTTVSVSEKEAEVTPAATEAAPEESKGTETGAPETTEPSKVSVETEVPEVTHTTTSHVITTTEAVHEIPEYDEHETEVPEHDIYHDEIEPEEPSEHENEIEDVTAGTQKPYERATTVIPKETTRITEHSEKTTEGKIPHEEAITTEYPTKPEGASEKAAEEHTETTHVPTTIPSSEENEVFATGEPHTEHPEITPERKPTTRLDTEGTTVRQPETTYEPTTVKPSEKYPEVPGTTDTPSPTEAGEETTHKPDEEARKPEEKAPTTVPPTEEEITPEVPESTVKPVTEITPGVSIHDHEVSATTYYERATEPSQTPGSTVYPEVQPTSPEAVTEPFDTKEREKPVEITPRPISPAEPETESTGYEATTHSIVVPSEEETTNEIPEEEHVIPGEGSCLVDGQTYKNNSSVPPINHCQVSCKCVSSILQCKSIDCTPPPSNFQNCMPVYQGPESCCPTYSCSVPANVSMESDSHKMETTTVTITTEEAREATTEVSKEATTKGVKELETEEPGIGKTTQKPAEAIPPEHTEIPEHEGAPTVQPVSPEISTGQYLPPEQPSATGVSKPAEESGVELSTQVPEVVTGEQTTPTFKEKFGEEPAGTETPSVEEHGKATTERAEITEGTTEISKEISTEVPKEISTEAPHKEVSTHVPEEVTEHEEHPETTEAGVTEPHEKEKATAAYPEAEVTTQPKEEEEPKSTSKLEEGETEKHTTPMYEATSIVTEKEPEHTTGSKIPKRTEVPEEHSEVPEYTAVPEQHITEVPGATEETRVPEIPKETEIPEHTQPTGIPTHTEAPTKHTEIPELPDHTKIPEEPSRTAGTTEIPEHTRMPEVTEHTIVPEPTEVPEHTGIPEVYEHTEAPEISEYTKATTTPSMNIPEYTAEPEMTEGPEILKHTEIPEVPEHPKVPEGTEVPETSEPTKESHTEAPEVPEHTKVPEGTEVPETFEPTKEPHTEAPEVPEHTKVPEGTAIPETSEPTKKPHTEVPEVPEHTEIPEATPEYIEQTEASGLPKHTEVTEIPEGTKVPEIPEHTEVPVSPEHTVTPETPEFTVTSKIIEQTEVPQITEAGSRTEVPSAEVTEGTPKETKPPVEVSTPGVTEHPVTEEVPPSGEPEVARKPEEHHVETSPIPEQVPKKECPEGEICPEIPSEVTEKPKEAVPVECPEGEICPAAPTVVTEKPQGVQPVQCSEGEICPEVPAVVTELPKEAVEIECPEGEICPETPAEITEKPKAECEGPECKPAEAGCPEGVDCGTQKAIEATTLQPSACEGDSCKPTPPESESHVTEHPEIPGKEGVPGEVTTSKPIQEPGKEGGEECVGEECKKPEEATHRPEIIEPTIEKECAEGEACETPKKPATEVPEVPETIKPSVPETTPSAEHITTVEHFTVPPGEQTTVKHIPEVTEAPKVTETPCKEGESCIPGEEAHPEEPEEGIVHDCEGEDCLIPEEEEKPEAPEVISTTEGGAVTGIQKECAPGEKCEPTAETTSHVTEGIPEATRKVPTVTESVPSATEEIPSVTEGAPSITEGVPTITEEVPSATEKIPSVSEEIPSITEGVPSITEGAPAVTEGVPLGTSSVTDEIPSVTEGVPRSTKVPSTEEGTKVSVTEGEASVTEGVPTLTEEVPTVTEGVPLVTGVPSVTEELPSATEEMPSVTERVPSEEDTGVPECVRERCEPSTGVTEQQCIGEDCKYPAPVTQVPCRGEGCRPEEPITEPPCVGESCPPVAHVTQPPTLTEIPCVGENCLQPSITELPRVSEPPCIGDDCPIVTEIPCTGEDCKPSGPIQPCTEEGCQPSGRVTEAPCDGKDCKPSFPEGQVPCEEEDCIPVSPPTEFPEIQPPCQGDSCSEATAAPTVPEKLPCDGESCPSVTQAPEVPCEGEDCEKQVPVTQSPCVGEECVQPTPSGEPVSSEQPVPVTEVPCTETECALPGKEPSPQEPITEGKPPCIGEYCATQVPQEPVTEGKAVCAEGEDCAQPETVPTTSQPPVEGTEKEISQVTAAVPHVTPSITEQPQETEKPEAPETVSTTGYPEAGATEKSHPPEYTSPTLQPEHPDTSPESTPIYTSAVMQEAEVTTKAIPDIITEATKPHEVPEKVTEPQEPSATTEPSAETEVPPEKEFTAPTEGPKEIPGVTTIIPHEATEVEHPTTQGHVEEITTYKPVQSTTITGEAHITEAKAVETTTLYLSQTEETKKPEEVTPGQEEEEEGPKITTEELYEKLSTIPGITITTTKPELPAVTETGPQNVTYPEEVPTVEVASRLQPPRPGVTVTYGTTGAPEIETTTTYAGDIFNKTLSTSEEGLYTSGPSKEMPSRPPSIEGELSTSPTVSSHTFTTMPSTTTTISSHEIPEGRPELPDYTSPGEEYEDEDQGTFGPGTCRYGGKVYVSAQQIPRDDPCDFCFCFRSDIICLQQSCPPPIPRCHEEPIRGFCCPRYECPVSMATSINMTTTTTTTTTTIPPHFLEHAFQGRATKTGCQIKGRAYQVGEPIKSASGPCLHCTCGGNGQMKCDPKACSPEPMLRQMITAAASKRRR